MAKSRSNTLSILIKSLSKSEKRYFKLSQTSSGDKKFLRLFELMDVPGEVDEDAILASEPMFDPSQFSNLKAHLYTKILKSLRDFSMKSIIGIEIRETIDEAQILFNKSLYQQCAARLKKAEKLAAQTDNHELQLEVLKWKKRVLNHTLDRENLSYVDEIVEKVRLVNNRINNINTFSNLQAKLQSLYRKTGYIRSEREFRKVEQIFTSNLPLINEQQLSISEKISLYNVFIEYYFFVQDFDQGLEYAKKWVELFRQNKSLIRPKLEDYIAGINYLLIALNKLERLREFEEARKELRTLNKLPGSYYNENIRLKMLKYTFVHEFNRLFLSGEFDKGVELIERLDSGLDKFIEQLDGHSRVILFYKTACLYFGNSDFKSTTYWLNKILVSGEGDLREDINGFARILNLISHYELGNIDLIQYYVRSTYRFLLKTQDLHQYQRLILRFLKGLNRQMTEEEVTNRFKALKEKMIEIQDNPYEKRAFVYFDMVSWLESRISKRPVMDVIKERARKRMAELAA